MNINNLELFALTDVGKKRPNNEDQAGLFNGDEFKSIIIADGMGGHSAGEVASSIAVNTIIKFFSLTPKPESVPKAKKMLHKVVRKANTSIHKLAISKSKYYGMGTTLVMALALDNSTLIVNCGDSRAYSYKRQGNKFQRITSDQTVVQYLYSMGSITKEEMLTSPKRHVLMNAMGIASTIDYDLYEIPNDYDLLLCCSDGLTNMVSDEEIKTIIEENIDDKIEILTQNLLDTALDNGGLDNISVSVMEAK
jgi:protein phosphatase